MLGKLFKYEMGATGRYILPMYGLWILISLVSGLTLRPMLDSGMLALPLIASMIYMAITMGAVVVTVVVIVQRFYKNLFGKEGYLMMSLPVSASGHLWCKIGAATIWGTVGMILGYLSIMLMLSSNQFYDFFKLVFVTPVQEYGLLLGLLLEFQGILITIIGIATNIMSIYMCIAIGSLWTSHRILGALLAVLGLTTIQSIFGGIMVVFVTSSRNNPHLLDFIERLGSGDFGTLESFTLGLLVISVISYAICHVVTNIILKNRLNLE